jgi:hypothetical protein
MDSVADMLSVANLHLGSTSDFLDVSLLGGATPGDYVIATYSGSLTGTFNNVTPGYSVSYATPGQVILTVPALAGLGAIAPVPEPTAAILAIIAGCVVGLMRRRR